MKLLLTSDGLSNKSIADAFEELIGKKPSDSKVAYIITAADCDRNNKSWLIDNLYKIKEYGYIVDIIDIAVLKPSVIQDILINVDAIFVGGGNSFYLSYWMQKSGLFELLPKLLQTKVYAGISAGSMIASNSLRISSQALKNEGILSNDDYSQLGPIGESSARTLQLINYEFKPHLNSSHHPEIRSEQYVRNVAEKIGEPIYAIDDQSALKVIDDKIEVISEGKWLLLNSR